MSLGTVIKITKTIKHYDLSSCIASLPHFPIKEKFLSALVIFMYFERFIEDQAFSPSYDLAAHPLFSLSVSSTGDIQDWDERQPVGRGAKSCGRKYAWSSKHHSILSGISMCKCMSIWAVMRYVVVLKYAQYSRALPPPAPTPSAHSYHVYLLSSYLAPSPPPPAIIALSSPLS